MDSITDASHFYPVQAGFFWPRKGRSSTGPGTAGFAYKLTGRNVGITGSMMTDSAGTMATGGNDGHSPTAVAAGEWQGFNRMVTGDSREVMKRLPADSIDLGFRSAADHVEKSCEQGQTFRQ